MPSCKPSLLVPVILCLACARDLPYEDANLPASYPEEAAPLEDVLSSLEELLRGTPVASPEYPDLLFRYAEALGERATKFRVEAFALEERAYAETDAEVKKVLREKALAQREEEKALLKKALQIYSLILRDYPDYPKRDQILFFMGFFYQEKKEPPKALEFFKRLVKNHPSSRYYPEALLAVAEHYFAENQISEALLLYQKLEEFPESRVYGYALYKQGWCQYNLGRFPQAMQKFIEVARHSREKGLMGSSGTLLRESLRDMVRAYSQFGAPEKARALFLKVGGEEYLGKMLLWLARHYEEMGRSAEAGIICLDYQTAAKVLENCP